MNAIHCVGRRFGARLKDGRLLGHVQVLGTDDPWLEGTFVPSPAFEELRDLFERETSLANDQIITLWEEAAAAIEALGIQLEDEEGHRLPVSRFSLEGLNACVRL